MRDREREREREREIERERERCIIKQRTRYRYNLNATVLPTALPSYSAGGFRPLYPSCPDSNLPNRVLWFHPHNSNCPL